MSEFYYSYDVYSLSEYEKVIQDKLSVRDCLVGSSKENDSKVRMKIFQDYSNYGKRNLQLMLDIDDLLSVKRLRSGSESIYLFWQHFPNQVDIIEKFNEGLDTRIEKVKIAMKNINVSSVTTVEVGHFFSHILDVNEQIEGSGIFGFTKNESIVPSKENTFFYQTTFIERKIISYTIGRSSLGKMIVNIEHPILPEDIELEVRGSNSLPLSKKYSSQEGKKIILKANTYSTPNIIMDVDKEKEYRLFFVNEVYNKIYSLKDLSYIDFNGIINTETSKKKEFFIKENRKYKKPFETKNCVYCFRTKANYESEHKTNRPQRCTVEFTRDTERLKEEMLVSNVSKKFTIGLHGQTSCGKSVYLGSLLGIKSSIGTNMNYLSSTMGKYLKQKKILYSPLLYKNTRESDSTRGLVGRKLEYPAFEMPFSSYIIEKGCNLPSATDASGKTIETSFPYCLKIGNSKEVYIYDIAGGNSLKDEYSPASCCDSMIFLLDVSSREKVEITKELIKKYLDKENDRNKLDSKGNSKTVVAIAITMLDKLIVNNDLIDENCYLQKVESYKEKKTVLYEGSNEQNCINQSSREIESLLTIKGYSDLLELVRARFNYFKFFAVSALGDDKLIFNNDGVGINCLKYEANPIRIEQPLLWILYQMGYIE